MDIINRQTQRLPVTLREIFYTCCFYSVLINLSCSFQPPVQVSGVTTVAVLAMFLEKVGWK
jgi:hypothetical protein